MSNHSINLPYFVLSPPTGIAIPAPARCAQQETWALVLALSPMRSCTVISPSPPDSSRRGSIMWLQSPSKREIHQLPRADTDLRGEEIPQGLLSAPALATAVRAAMDSRYPRGMGMLRRTMFAISTPVPAAEVAMKRKAVWMKFAVSCGSEPGGRIAEMVPRGSYRGRRENGKARR